MPRRDDHEVHKGYVVALEKKKYLSSPGMCFKSEHPLYLVGRLHSSSQRLDCHLMYRLSFAQRGLNYNLESYPVVLRSSTARCPSEFDRNNRVRAMSSASAEDIPQAPCVSVLDVAI